MTLNYKIEGYGPPLLLVHGLGVTFSIWKELVPRLSPYYKLILVELPGNGASPVADLGLPYYAACAAGLEALHQDLGIECWDMLCYSAGAWAGQAALARDPQQTRRVVFLCPALLNPGVSLGLRLLGGLVGLFPSLAGLLLSGWRLGRLVRLLGFNNHPHPYALEWQDELQSQPVSTLVRMLLELPGGGRAPFTLPGLPTLFIWGRQDLIARHPRPLAARDRLIDASHSAPQLAAAQVAELVLAFLDH